MPNRRREHWARLTGSEKVLTSAVQASVWLERIWLEKRGKVFRLMADDVRKVRKRRQKKWV